MTDKPLVDYRTLSDPMIRSVIDKLRSNALLAAIHQCGGEITLTEEVMGKIRGHVVVIRRTDSGDFKFMLIRKPSA
jgi:hypothetical protein